LLLDDDDDDVDDDDVDAPVPRVPLQAHTKRR
jgi:hypothetical protein